jgi:hypothetical protein
MLLTFCLAACPIFGIGEGILCMPCTLCLLVLGESGQLVSGCRVREAISSSCSMWQWYWQCAYRVVVPFFGRIPFVNSVVSAGFPSVVEALPPLWRGSVVCVWGSSVWDMLPCAVRFLGRALDSVHWGLISSKYGGAGTLT